MFPPLLFLTFAAGALIAEAVLYIPPIKEDLAFAVFCDASAFIAVMAIALIPRYTIAEATRQPECWWVHGYIGIWSMVLFSSLRRPRSLVCRFLGFKHMSTLGEYAYHMYVLQYPVFTGIRRWRWGHQVTYERVPLNEWTMNVVVTIILSYFVNDWLEAPYVRLLKRACDHVAKLAYGEKKKQEIILTSKGHQPKNDFNSVREPAHSVNNSDEYLPLTSTRGGRAPMGAD